MKNKLTLLCVSLTFILLISSCKEEKAKAATQPTITKRKVPGFNSDQAYEHIEKQLSFGYRVPGTQAHSDVVEWIETSLEGYGAKVIKQGFKASFFNQQNISCTNIMGQFNPTVEKRILLAAHFDSRAIADKDDEDKDKPILGADDGGSGVGVLLALAQMISEYPIDIGVDFLFFDAEDQGEPGTAGDPKSWAQGSQYWATNIVPNGYRPKYGILLDMVGSDKATFGKEEYSQRFAPGLQNKIWTLAKNMGYSDFFSEDMFGGVYDDHIPVNRDARIPMVDIINQSPTDRSSFGAYHHTHDDDMDVISKRTLKVVGQVVAAVLYNESNGTF